MYNHFSKLILAMGVCSFSCTVADEGIHVVEGEAPVITSIELSKGDDVSHPPTSSIRDPAVTPILKVQPIVERSIPAFTGKIKGKKVRMRAGADLESRVVKELTRSDLLSIVGEKGDFYAVEPPSGTKAYVFRSFVLDGVVEGNRVNVRLEPSLDAPVISHLNAGDHIRGVISSLNNKWYEITPPADAHFYVAKEFVESIGGPEVKLQLEKRKMAAENLLSAAALLTKSEMQKPFNEIDVSHIKQNYETVTGEFADFPDLVERAAESVAALNESYLQKKIDFLEERTSEKMAIREEKSEALLHPTDRMKLWEPIEESLYLGWSSRNDDRSIDEFYDEQKQNAVIVTGIVEAYMTPVKRKPGDFIIRDKELPVAYVYSTQVNLQDYVGKKVTIVATPRSNNNFAFPAYYVLSVE